MEVKPVFTVPKVKLNYTSSVLEKLGILVARPLYH